MVTSFFVTTLCIYQGVGSDAHLLSQKERTVKRNKEHLFPVKEDEMSKCKLIIASPTAAKMQT